MEKNAMQTHRRKQRQTRKGIRTIVLQKVDDMVAVVAVVVLVELW